jgi:acyl-coenzyme A thioesterase PaaI-like protein
MSRRVMHKGRITQVAGEVELSAKTRELLAELIRDHGDDRVSFAEFMVTTSRMNDHLRTLPERERLEACGRILEATFGAGVRYRGWGTL